MDQESITIEPSVILVDDEPTIVALYAHAVRRRGFEAVTFGGVEEALDRIAEQKPHMVISDVQMPGIGGFDFCAMLQERGQKNFPFLFLTAHDDIDVLRLGLAAGGDDFLIKGTSVLEIMDRIRLWLGSGFRGLPRTVRDRAIPLARKEQGDVTPPMSEYVSLRPAIPDAVAEQLRRELQSMPADFGERLAERIQILGRLDALLHRLIQDCGALIRFPDYVIATLYRLEFDWVEDSQVLMAGYDDYLDDVRFRKAAEGTFKPVLADD